MCSIRMVPLLYTFYFLNHLTGGLKAAFHAFNDWTGTRGDEELLLPGLNLTRKQLFFLAFAQVQFRLDFKRIFECLLTIVVYW